MILEINPHPTIIAAIKQSGGFEEQLGGGFRETFLSKFRVSKSVWIYQRVFVRYCQCTVMCY